MKLAKRIVSLALCAVLALSLVPAASAAASVRVTLPQFRVTLGGQTIDPAKEEYPFLVYKDITYLPLTYFGCRLLGLYAKWSPETGLIVTDAGAKGAYQSSPRVSRNGGALYASVATGPIEICSKRIENDREEYPFLLFRDITYLPMTWANMHDLLGCDYRWNAKEGLVIDRAEDANTSALYLPIYRYPSGDSVGIGSIAAWRGWFWYQDSDGWISRTPMAGGEREKLFELPINVLYSETTVLASLRVVNDRLYLSYHLGGATMGHDELYRFDEDGSCVALTKFNGPLGEFDELWLQANCNLTPIPDNLDVSRDRGETWERFGEENYIYGWAYHQQTSGGAWASHTIGDILNADGGWAYLLATDATGWGAAEPDANGEYPERFSKVSRVDLTSGATKQLTGPARAFQIAGNRIWYVGFDAVLRHCGLDGSDDAAMAFDALASVPEYADMDQAKVVSFTADGALVYAELSVPFRVQGGAGVEPRTEQMTCLAVLNADGSGGTIAVADTGAVRSMHPEDGWLTLLTQSSSGEMRLFVLHDGKLVYQNAGPDYLAAGVSGGKLYYVLR